jgi:DNA-3-methyladenine glycosylase
VPRLPRDFYARDTRVVARALLGRVIATPARRARIVETEAYHGRADAASHAHRGQTARNAPMFGAAGHAYVYLIYGVWNCFNVVTMEPGYPAAVLVRAAELLEPGADPREAAGPGKLCQALGLTRAHSGQDLVLGDQVWLEDDGTRVPPRRIARGPRVGVAYAGAWAERPWRYWVRDSRAVSR